LIVPGQPVLDESAELTAAASSGLMALTGPAGGPPVAPPPGLVTGLDSLAADIGRWSSEVGQTVEVDWATLLNGRAAILGLGRQGRRSASGSCRLLRAGDRWAVFNLARPEDIDAVGAIVGGSGHGRPWDTLAAAAERTTGDDLVTRARLLGVPAALLPTRRDGGTTQTPPWTATNLWPSIPVADLTELQVVDLSSMWAGPLTAMILARARATVTKVESASRPDGARAVPEFYRTLHPAGQPEVKVDFSHTSGRAQLRALLDGADVVIESSRPRALEQLGAGPSEVAPRPGRVWVSITGYGRTAPGRDWVAFGDDAAVAGGLVGWEAEDLPVFCGDAIADPITGLTAAAAVLEALAGGGGMLLDVAMSRCATAVTSGPASINGPIPIAVAATRGAWEIEVDGVAVPIVDRRFALEA
jgi:CoA transferase family III